MKWSCPWDHLHFDINTKKCNKDAPTPPTPTKCNPYEYRNSTSLICVLCNNTLCYECQENNSNICIACATNMILINQTCFCNTSSGNFLFINGSCLSCGSLLSYC